MGTRNTVIGAAIGCLVALASSAVIPATAWGYEESNEARNTAVKHDGYFLDHEQTVALGGVGNYVPDSANVREEPAQAAAEPMQQPAIADVLGGEPAAFYFAAGKSDLSTGDKAKLDDIANRMKQAPDSKVVVAGYADHTGSKQTNEVVSEDRAKNVVSYLEEKGISSERIQSVAYGNSKAKVPTGGKIANAADRKVVITQATA